MLLCSPLSMYVIPFLVIKFVAMSNLADCTTGIMPDDDDSPKSVVHEIMADSVSALFGWFSMDQDDCQTTTAAEGGSESHTENAAVEPQDNDGSSDVCSSSNSSESGDASSNGQTMAADHEEGMRHPQVQIEKQESAITHSSQSSSDEEDPPPPPCMPPPSSPTEKKADKKAREGGKNSRKRRIALAVAFILGGIVVIAITVGLNAKNGGGSGMEEETPQGIAADYNFGEEYNVEPNPRPLDGAPPGEGAAAPSAVGTTAASSPTNAPTSTPLFYTFSFYVMGDAPYNKNQQVIVNDQIVELSNEVTEEDIFLVHVGDAMNANNGCNEEDYAFMRDLFVENLPHLPSFIIPGDNDWRDCKNRRKAWKLWTSHFMALESKWSGTKPFLDTVVRQPERQENFAFTTHGVLFMGLHVLGGGTTDSDLTDRMDGNEAWIDVQVHQHETSLQNGRIRAVVVFGHAMNTLRLRLLEHMRNKLIPFGLPVLYIKGDKHTFDICDSFQGIGWEGFTIVQVEQGGNAPPNRITVRGTTPPALQKPFGILSSDEIMLGDFIKIDRRGGLYSWAPMRDGNLCGAVSRGEEDIQTNV